MKKLIAVVSLTVVTANAFAIWNVTDGYFDDPASWSQGYVPTNTSQNAQWWYERNVEATVRLRDRVGLFNLFCMQLFSGYNQTVTFDGAGADFSMGAIPSGSGQRSEYYPFSIQNGNGNDYYSFFVHTGGSKTKSVFRWTNVLTRVRHAKGSSVDDSEIHLSFERGYSCFAGTDGTDKQTTIYVGYGAHSGRHVGLVVTNGAEVVMPNLDISGKGSVRTSVTVTGAGSRLRSVGYMKAGSGSSIKAGTNVWRVADGGCLRADGAVVFGDASSPSRINELHVSGAGSVADFSRASSVAFYNEPSLTISDGAVLALPSSTVLAGTTAGIRNAVTIDGTGGVICLTNASNTSILTVGTVGEGVFTLKGGTLRATDASSTLAVELGRNAGGCGIFRMEDGTLLCGSASSSSIRDISVGLAGSGIFEVAAGSVSVPNYVLLGKGDSAPTVAVTNVYRQTGGYVAVDGWISVSRPSDSLRTASVELDGGILKTTRIMGGGDIEVASGVVSELRADGGTLRARTSIDLSNKYPFIYGFRKAELGSKGLTVDMNGCNVNIAQRLTNKAGQTGRLIVTGSGTTYLSADGSDLSELVCAGGLTRFESNVTDWETTAVVTNGARLSLSQVTGLSLDGLVLGDAVSAGRLGLATTTRVTLESLALVCPTLVFENGFVADTDYPVLTVRGTLDAATQRAWMTAIVEGTVPSGSVAQFGASYSQAENQTTLTVRFATKIEATEANSWQGASGTGVVSWDAPGNWSKGLPGAASIVTFDGEGEGVSATVSVPTVGSLLGAMAFASSRDYTLIGDGSLLFANGYAAKFSVDAGDHRIDVPVDAVGADIEATVASGASLTFGRQVVAKTGTLVVNPTRTGGRVRLEGTGCSR